MPLQMPGHPTIEPIVIEDKDLLRKLMQTYRHDMSEFNLKTPWVALSASKVKMSSIEMKRRRLWILNWQESPSL
jgi:hypothetical protein